jgi:hypothetical protein
MASYAVASHYRHTPLWGPFLDIWKGVVFPTDVGDALYQIDPPYNLRPDLLAYDMYQDSNLWWVFAVRNPNTLVDPLFDFVAPTIIYVPSLSVVKATLGL